MALCYIFSQPHNLMVFLNRQYTSCLYMCILVYHCMWLVGWVPRAGGGRTLAWDGVERCHMAYARNLFATIKFMNDGWTLPSSSPALCLTGITLPTYTDSGDRHYTGARFWNLPTPPAYRWLLRAWCSPPPPTHHHYHSLIPLPHTRTRRPASPPKTYSWRVTCAF